MSWWKKGRECVEEEDIEGERKRKRKEVWDVPFRKA